MRRRTRTLLMLVSALCALLFALSILLWVRSYWTADGVAVLCRAGSSVTAEPVFQLFSMSGVLVAIVNESSSSGDWAYDSVNFGSAPLVSQPGESHLSPLTFRWIHFRAQTGPRAALWVAAPVWCFPLVFMVVGGAGLLIVYRARRRQQTGQCARCGYDLTGNVSGVCPECGETAPEA
jgi:hypothetical protein